MACDADCGFPLRMLRAFWTFVVVNELVVLLQLASQLFVDLNRYEVVIGIKITVAIRILDLLLIVG